jgi:hypothetical protein
MQTLIQAEFFGTPVSIIDHARRRWLTARDVGRCLGYAEEHAKHAILKLYSRHADEFTPEDVGVVNLTTPGGLQETRIFSHTGCIKLGFFASTAKAKAFRAWAAQTLAQAAPSPAQMAARLLPPPKITRRMELTVLQLFAQGASLREIHEATGISKAAISQITHGTYRFAPGSGECLTTPELLQQVAARHVARDMEQVVRKYCGSLANRDLQDTLNEAGMRFIGRWQALEEN